MKTNQKRWIAVLLSAALMLAMGVSALAATAVEQPTVTVSATSQMDVEPDIAYITLGVRTENKSAPTARSENAKLMKKVTEAVKKLGIAEKDIKTSDMSLYTNYDWTDGKRTLTGYTCNNTLKITVRDVDMVGDVVDAAMANGANQFDNVRFDLEDSEEYYLQVLEKATKKAALRAKTTANAAGMNLGTVLSLSTNNSSYTPYYAYLDNDVEAVEEEAATADTTASSGIGSTIQSGTISVSATVNATYALTK